MDRYGDHGLRLLGVMAGIGAALPVGYFAYLAIEWHSTNGSVLFGGIALALLVATVAVADGQAWGALVIALYGAGMALFICGIDRARPYATGNDADLRVVALHAAVGVLALIVAHGLVRGGSAPSAPLEGPP